jgi:DNA-binding LytR/AlgR family response regulator
MKIRTLIVDDEPHAIEVVEKYTANFPEIEVVAKCKNGLEAFNLLQREKIDLMFLDIKMPQVSGLDLVRSLKNPPRIIFTTAYQDFALDGFDLNAVDYLLKPISFERFLKAMDKIFALNLTQTQPVMMQANIEQKSELFIYLRADRKTVKVNVNDIYWVESLKDYIKVVLKDRVLMSKQKISIVEQLLPQEKFLRIHRSFIVSLDKIDSYKSFAIEILGKELPIGRNYKTGCSKVLHSVSS